MFTDTGEPFVTETDPGIGNLLKLCAVNLDTLTLVELHYKKITVMLKVVPCRPKTSAWMALFWISYF